MKGGTSIATCEPGDVVFEGGYAIFSVNVNLPPFEIFEGPLPHPVITSYTGPNNSAYGVTLLNFGPITTEYEAYAYCFDNSP